MNRMKKTMAGLCALCISFGSSSVLGTSDGISTASAASKDIS